MILEAGNDTANLDNPPTTESVTCFIKVWLYLLWFSVADFHKLIRALGWQTHTQPGWEDNFTDDPPCLQVKQIRWRLLLCWHSRTTNSNQCISEAEIRYFTDESRREHTTERWPISVWPNTINDLPPFNLLVAIYVSPSTSACFYVTLFWAVTFMHMENIQEIL